MNKIFYSVSIASISLSLASVYFGSQPKQNSVSVGVVKQIEQPITKKAKTRKKAQKVTKVYKTDFKLVKVEPTLKLTPKERQCMVKNAFHEAGVDGVKGMVAVLQVTHARLGTQRWGKSFCSVIYAKAQFSWTLEKNLRTQTPAGELWEMAKEAVSKFEKGYRIEGLGDALFYHTDYIEEPKWASYDHSIGKIGKHIFYKRALTAEDLKKNT